MYLYASMFLFSASLIFSYYYYSIPRLDFIVDLHHRTVLSSKYLHEDRTAFFVCLILLLACLSPTFPLVASALFFFSPVQQVISSIPPTAFFCYPICPPPFITRRCVVLVLCLASYCRSSCPFCALNKMLLI